MPRNPKIFIHGTFVSITSRIEHGLPIPPNEIMDKLMTNALARAQHKYPVTLISYVIMPNHAHLNLVVQDPKDVPKFVEYFKRESAYYINRLMGLKKHTVWAEGYDSPVVLDYETALLRLLYVHVNPVASDFIEKGRLWPLSSASWINSSKSSSSISVKRIPRNQVKKLPHRKMSIKEINNFAKKMEFRGKEKYTLKIEPDAWQQCFAETRQQDPKKLREVLYDLISRRESELAQSRGKELPSLEDLMTQDIRKEHVPSKFGLRMICLAKNKINRIAYLGWYRNLCKSLPCFFKKVSSEISYRSGYPPGFFAPGGFLWANILPSAAPTAFIG